MLVSKDGSTFFAEAYDAHFNEIGFLEKIVFDKTKGHDIPTEWRLQWDTNLEKTISRLSTFGSVQVEKRDMSKSHFALSFNDVILTTTTHVYRFQVIDWSDKSENRDGLSSIVVTSL